MCRHALEVSILSAHPLMLSRVLTGLADRTRPVSVLLSSRTSCQDISVSAADEHVSVREHCKTSWLLQPHSRGCEVWERMAHLHAILPGVGDPPVINGVHNGAPSLVQSVPHHPKLLFHSLTAQPMPEAVSPCLPCAAASRAARSIHDIIVNSSNVRQQNSAFGAHLALQLTTDGLRAWGPGRRRSLVLLDSIAVVVFEVRDAP